MRASFWLGAAGISVAVFLSAGAAVLNLRQRSKHDRARVHVVLIGASIGQSWRLAEWSSRVQAQQFRAESVAEWQFDKSNAIQAVLRRPAIVFRMSPSYLKSLFQPPQRPDFLILKECSSYFPGDLPAYRNSIRNWVAQLRAGGLNVAVATVVPVSRSRSARDPGKQEALLEYNRWLRQFARESGIPLIDLESALGAPGDSACLRDEFAAADGSHLNPRAYAALDRLLLQFLCQIAPAGVEP